MPEHVTIDRPAPVSVLVTGTASDAHTWNLLYVQLLIEEAGYPVRNLGCCVSPEVVAAECAGYAPGLVVFSTVNGNGVDDGLAAIRHLRAAAPTVPAVIGGKLGIVGDLAADDRDRLLHEGFDAVFDDGTDPAILLERYLREIPARSPI